jgi:hypothetical protein
MLVMQIRQVAAHKKMLGAAEWQERQLVQQLDSELKRPRGPGRPRGLDLLEPEKRSEIIREVVRLDLERVSRAKIAEAVGVSERQVDRILGEKPAA